MVNQIICGNCLSNVDSSLAACPYCGQSFENTNPSGTLPINTVLADRYTIGKVIFVDGEGVLYAAVDNSTVRRVVVKEYVPITICAARARDGCVIPRQGREVLFKTTRMDFTDLYRALLSLGHTSGLVPVIDLVEANNTAYAVREPDDGIPLHTYLERRERPLTPEEAVLLMRPVIEGVGAMHRMGLLHRGISPETVFITKSGEARLSGYATLGLRTADSELKSQVYDGYAAPEQYAVAEFDGKYTDIYSLGALFYRLLTGRTPVPSNLRRMNDTLSPAHMVDEEIPGYASKAIARAMRLAPGERMQSASELLAALSTQEAEPEEPEALPITARQRQWLIIGVLGLLLVAGISIGVILSSANRRAELDSSSDSFSQTESVSDTSSDPLSSSSSESESNTTPETVPVPYLVGKKYADVATNPDYTMLFSFYMEHEYSDDYREGEIMRQSHAQGTQVTAGTVITLTVSDGPETAVMPTVVGRPQAEVEADLQAARIQYTILQMANDGTMKEGDVGRCSIDAGTAVEIGRQKALLYIAGPAPVSSSEPESSSGSSSDTNSSGLSAPESLPPQPDSSSDTVSDPNSNTVPESDAGAVQPTEPTGGDSGTSAAG